VKVKFTLEQVMKALRSKSIATLSSTSALNVGVW